MYSETLKLCGDKAQLMKGFEEHKSYITKPQESLAVCRHVHLLRETFCGPVSKKMATEFVMVASITATTQVRFVSFSKQKRVEAKTQEKDKSKTSCPYGRKCYRYLYIVRHTTKG